LRRDAGYYPVLTLTGPRQSGKTTLAKAAFPEHEYVSLERGDARAFAKDDPRGFLRRYSDRVVIDEAQRAPDLFSYIQTEVDEDDSPGRFVLTGSHNFLLMQSVSQSLAGRCAVLHVLPFSRAELEGQMRPEPDRPQSLLWNRRTGLDCWEVLRSGFYPRIHDKHIPPEVWLPDYVHSYLERDLRQIVNVGDLDTFERFLALCAGRCGQIVHYSALAADAGVSVDTSRRWVSALKTSFILFMLRPHYRNFNKRVIKSPKLYFYDSGLACHLLGIRNEEQLFAHPLRGALFENYVVAELAKSYLHHRREPPLWFWRDQAGHEVDVLVEEAGRLFAIEIKSGQTVASSMFDGLKNWQRISGHSPEETALVYGGAEWHTRQGIAVRPWFSI
jgi:predicted AAA+ superfamily ATPase